MDGFHVHVAGWQTKAMQKFLVLSLSAVLGTAVLISNAFGQANSAAADEQIAATLRERYQSLLGALSSNAYGRPLYLESVETSNTVTGNAYAVLNAPFSTVSSTFKSPNQWCDVMILHINTKYCRAVPGGRPVALNVHIGKKTPQTLQDSFPLEFIMRQVSATPELLAVQLNAADGPLGTSNYRIELRAIPLEANKTFMQLRYAYEYGMTGKIAMQGYLATAGRGKVGFSTNAPTQANAQPSYVGGARGAVERNTMRYFLAIDSYLQALPLPPSSQQNARLEKWFDATERYAAQLRETDRASYLAMKKSEIERQQGVVQAP